MLKNIIFSADEHLIRKARKKAKFDNTTLNSMFRQWLEKYSSLGNNSNDYEILMEQLSYAKPGQHYTRDEMNERWKYSFYDSLIVTSALQTDCSILYSEDLQHGQKIQSLTIINPYLLATT